MIILKRFINFGKRSLIMGRILVIGIDGGSFNIIESLIEKSLLPNFKRVIDNGVKSYLESTIHPSSEQAWPSFYTGTNNGKHGIFGYLKRSRKNYSFNIVSRLDVNSNSIFKIASENDKKVIVIGMPLTYPVEKVNGYMISGLFCPGKHVQWTYPEDFKSEVDKISPDYIMDLSQCNVKTKEELVKKNLECINGTGDLACKMLKDYEWDIFTVVFSSTDKIQHKFWRYHHKNGSKYKDVIDESYIEIDKYLGKFLDLVPKNTAVFIVSDHGFCKLEGGVVINNILKDNGYMVTKKSKLSSKVFRKCAKFLFKIHKKVFGIRYKSILKRYFPKIGSKLASSLAYTDINWARTKAFSVSAGNVCVNLKGREPEGCVSKEDYEDVRSSIINTLKEIKDNGVAVFNGVYKREEVYDGDFLKEAPDIIVNFRDGYRGIMFGFGGNEHIIKSDDIFIADNSGTHAQDGVFIVSGHAVKGSLKKKPRIIDVAPTILTLLGLKPTKEMDGVVLDIIGKKILKKKTAYNKEKEIIKDIVKDLNL